MAREFFLQKLYSFFFFAAFFAVFLAAFFIAMKITSPFFLLDRLSRSSNDSSITHFARVRS